MKNFTLIFDDGFAHQGSIQIAAKTASRISDHEIHIDNVVIYSDDLWFEQLIEEFPILA